MMDGIFQLRLRFIPFFIVIATVHGGGCAPIQPAIFLEEPPLTATLDAGDGGDADVNRQAEFTGQQKASFQLTDQGQGYLDNGRLNEAVSLFEKAISLHPSNPYAYYYLAKARYTRNEYPKTLPLLAKSELYLQGDPDWLSWVYALRGKTYEALSRYAEARGEYKQALSRNPFNPEALEGMDRLQHSSN